MEKLEPFIETLEQLGNDIPQIVELSKKSGQRVGHVVLAIVAVTAILVLIFLGPLILSVAITVIYPAYKSIEALESKDTDDDDKYWLTYWIIFGLITLGDQFFWFILELIPYYSWIRFGLFVAMFSPQIQGAKVVYETVLRKILTNNKDKIEKFIADIKNSASDI